MLPTFFNPAGSSADFLSAISDSSINCSIVSRDNCKALKHRRTSSSVFELGRRVFAAYRSRSSSGDDVLSISGDISITSSVIESPGWRSSVGDNAWAAAGWTASCWDGWWFGIGWEGERWRLFRSYGMKSKEKSHDKRPSAITNIIIEE